MGTPVPDGGMPTMDLQPLTCSKMSTPAPDGGPPTTDIILDEHGDVVFELGRNDGGTVTHLRVSSKILTLASPVFKAMFTHGFAESQDLSSTAPRLIPLPDDNTRAMVLLSRILHHKVARIPKKLSLGALVDLAILSDKYDCSVPLNVYGTLWVAELMESACKGRYKELLFATYILDLPEAFMKLTKMFLLGGCYTLDAGFLHSDHSQGFRDLLGRLETDRLEVCLQIVSEFERVVYATMDSALNDKDRRCSDLVAARFLRDLMSLDLWPITDWARSGSLSSLIRDVKDLPDCKNVDCDVDGCSACGAGNLPNHDLNLRLSKLENNTRGLCLDCVKGGRKVYRKKKCRVPH